jgi:hypothetical protein
MATYIVTKVHKETSADGSHEHIDAVRTTANILYSRKQVVDSIGAGNAWVTAADGMSATITPVLSCPHCSLSPYLKTNPDSSKKDNLENLDRC